MMTKRMIDYGFTVHYFSDMSFGDDKKEVPIKLKGTFRNNSVRSSVVKQTEVCCLAEKKFNV